MHGSYLGQDLPGAVVLHEPLDRMVLEEQPRFLRLRLAESVDAAHSLEDAVVVLRPFHQHHAAAFGMHVEPERAIVVGRQEDGGRAVRVGDVGREHTIREVA